jgi:hypothetical protein
MMGVLHIRPQLYIVLRHRCNTTQLPHLLLLVRLSDKLISPPQGTHYLPTKYPFKALFQATAQFSTRQTVDAGADIKRESIRTSSSASDPSPRSPELDIQYVWLHVVRLPNLRSLMDLHEPAMRLSLGSSQLPLSTNLPDPYRTTVQLPYLPSRLCRPRDYRNGSRPMGLQPAHPKSLWWQLCHSWTVGQCTDDF